MAREGFLIGWRVSGYTKNTMTIPMSVCRSAALCLALVIQAPAHAQEAPAPGKAPAEAPAPKLTLFDLDFPGGTPGELVEAIQRAAGTPVNAVIPSEDAKVELPPLKMRQVTTESIFRAMFEASRSKPPLSSDTFSSTYVESTFGFRTQGAASDGSVWYFLVNAPVKIQSHRTVNFFPLTPFLDEGLSVDDITTAINTGWKMLGGSDQSELSYHKETKLLIVVADVEHTGTVIKALEALRQAKSKPTIAPPTNKSSPDPAPGQ
jgi:hypothetical protein